MKAESVNMPNFSSEAQNINKGMSHCKFRGIVRFILGDKAIKF